MFARDMVCGFAAEFAVSWRSFDEQAGRGTHIGALLGLSPHCLWSRYRKGGATAVFVLEDIVTPEVFATVQRVAAEMLDEIHSSEAGIFTGDHLIAHQFITYELGGIPILVDFPNDHAHGEAMRVFGEIHALELWVFEGELRRIAGGSVNDSDAARFAAVPFIGAPGQRQALDAANQMCSGEV